MTRIVIWGLKKTYHTHRHIHQAFYKNAKKLGYNTVWVEDEPSSSVYIQPGDIIIASEVHGKMVPKKTQLSDYFLPIRDDVKYCLHNYQDIFKNKLKKENYINLQVYNTDSEKSDIQIDTARYFDTTTRTLYQPWGTDLLYSEFKTPVYNVNRYVFWIGSIWNNEKNQGNLQEISELQSVLKKIGLFFIHVRFIPDFMNRFLIRFSRIAPAISGRYQVEVNYLACRVFKNISYGQLGITNILKFKDILQESFVQGQTDSIEDLIRSSVALPKEKYIELVKAQQEKIKNYTYKESLHYIIEYSK